MTITREVLSTTFEDATVEELLALRKILEGLSRGEPEIPRCGICNNLLMGFPLTGTLDPYQVVETLSPYWLDYSGDLNYPIPGGEEAFYTPPLWEGKQLEYRKSLSQFLLDALEEYLKTPSSHWVYIPTNPTT